MKTRFKLLNEGDGKRLTIDGPWELKIEIDYDDVYHEVVNKEAEHLVEILNEEWPLNPLEIE